ncbi:amino acid adenylation domain-containing protein [Kitasatospora sp. NPDC058162]|uniref:amino acid adenylation domain-containing protein n=1 Tax=Kitasatospora sp. NPDC058162 TaxID=3346362 RepID=UPI0036DF99D9
MSGENTTTDGEREYFLFGASRIQQQLFYLQQLLGDAPTYHIPQFFTVRGGLDERALHDALGRLVERHEALRTHFVLLDGELLQAVDPETRVDWRVHDCPTTQALDECMAQEVARPFDLERGPLFRAVLMRRDASESVLLLNAHHTVADGWSLDVLVEELFGLYSALARGEEPALPEVEFQYADYSGWQEEWLAGAGAEAQRAFWSRTLEGELPILPLPADLPGDPHGTATPGATLRLPLPQDAVDALRKLARSTDSTLFMALFSAFTVLLRSWTGVEDLVVGTAVANRNRPEFARTVGMFVNTVAVRTDLTGDPEVPELLRRVRESVLRAQDHQDLPFEAVVDEVGPGRLLVGENPIFQVFFTTGDGEQLRRQVAGLDVVPVEDSATTAKFPLLFDVQEDGPRVVCAIDYRTDLFSPERIEELARSFSEVVRNLADRPDARVSELLAPTTGEIAAAPRSQAPAPSAPTAPSPYEDEVPYVAPESDLEVTLAGIWAKVLDLNRVGIDDNYFEIGGDSIRSVQILAHTRDASLKMSLMDLMLHQTVRELALVVAPADEPGIAPAAPPVHEPFRLLDPADRAAVPEGVEDAYPMTALQQGMLYHSEASRTRQIYHNVESYHLRALYSEEAWRWTIEQVIGRHELFRTSFALDGFREPTQLVHRRITPPITFEDIGDLSPREQEQAVEARFRWEEEHPFDWGTAPLIRFHVQRRGDDACQFWVISHHAIMDGWSERSLFTELMNLYVRRLREPDAPVPAPPASRYATFVALEREAVRSEEQQAFWTGLLKDATLSALPRSRPATGAPRMAIGEFALPQELSRSVVAVAKRMATPVRIVLLTAHLRVMSLLSGSPDTVTGVVYNGRPEEADGDRVVGLFLNTVPFRLRAAGGTWADLIRQVTAVDLGIQPNRRYPMPELQRWFGSTPIFESFFNYTHFHVTNGAPSDDELTVVEERSVVPTNFTFGAEFSRDESGDDIELALRYDASQFDAEEIERYFGYYRAALSALTAGVDQSYAQTPLLSAGELSELDGWNATDLHYARSHVLHTLVEEQARVSPERVAVVFGGTRLTYEELDRRANRMAQRLRELGAGRDGFVGVCMERSADMVVALLAVLKSGAAYVPVSPEDPAARIGGVLEEAEPVVVLVSEKHAVMVRGACRAQVVVADESLGADLPETAPAVDVSPDDRAYMIFTSGSTGRPKGVLVSHRAICNRLLWMQEEFTLTPDDRVLQKTPHTFDVSVWEFFWPLLTGAGLVVAKPGGHRDPVYLAELIRRESVTTVHFVPSMLRAFLDADVIGQCTGLVRVICSGEALTHEVQERFHAAHPARLTNLYGPTEAAVDVTCWHCERGGSGDIVPIGRPIANMRTHVLDADGHPAPVGVPGELYLAGVGLAEGYHRRPELTGEFFAEHPTPSGGTERRYRTGDLVRRLPDGSLEYLGRVDHQVKIRGFRVELQEIEAVLSLHPDVAACAVALRDERLVAFVVPAAGRSHSTCPGVDDGALRAFLTKRLPDHMVPGRWQRLDALPLSANGKTDRKALPELASDGQGRRTVTPPVTGPQKRLMALWEELFDVRPIGVHDTFTELGGHSLLALRLLTAIRREFGQSLLVTDLLRNDTVAALAEALTRSSGRDTTSPGARLFPLRTAGEARSTTPLFLVHPVGGGILCYRELVASLTTAGAVHGLSVESLPEDVVGTLSVESIAAQYLGLVREERPTGPYRLAGWSFGGVVALEMARRLREAGEDVELLFVIDAGFPRQEDGEPDEHEAATLLLTDLLGVAGLRAGSGAPDLSAGTRAEFLDELTERLTAAGLPEAVDAERLASALDVLHTHALAHSRYRPRTVPGDVTFVEGTATRETDSTAGWRTVVGGTFTVHAVDADHYDLVRSPVVKQVAALIDTQLDLL